MGKIILEGMEFFAYHGCFREEKIIGTKFMVDLEVEVDTAKAEKSDDLHDTVNYQALFKLVKQQMEIKSNLLENVASRILGRIKDTFPEVTTATVKIAKLNPPLGGKIRQVSCILTY
ncbi:MAG: dihydroneopterin aldolase [Syntrophothermus sp.]